MFSKVNKQKVQEINVSDLSPNGVKLLIQREDLNDEHCMGNKWWKLKYNLLEATRQKKTLIVTFGGAYSNHIVATAWGCRQIGLSSVGIIRGEPVLPLNPSLEKAQSFGMKFHFLDRSTYKMKDQIDWSHQFPNCYLLPEGGTNQLAVKGCREMLYHTDFDIVCVPVGTGGTLAGVINGLESHQQAMGFSCLKNGHFLKDTVHHYLNSSTKHWTIQTDYHFGGYAKLDAELIDFMNKFKQIYAIPLDPIYTSKMMYGIFDLIKKEKIRPNSTILAIHTGGLQGIEGMNQRLNAKGWNID